MTNKTWWEKIETKGGEAIDQLGRLINEGNIRRVRVRQKDRVVAEFPLTIGVVGVVFAPVLAAIGALTALITECTIEVERQAPREQTAADTQPAVTPPPDAPPPVAAESGPPPPIA